MTEKRTKKIAMIIAPQDFRDEEYFIPKSVFETEGFEVKTASEKTGEIVGSYGGVTTAEISLENLNVSEFDAVVFVGGSGAYKYIEDELCHQIAKNALKENKVLAAICIGPAILAKSGVLQGKRATVWSSHLDKSAIKILKENGALYEKEKVVADGKIITASGPQAARKFAEVIVETLRG